MAEIGNIAGNIAGNIDSTVPSSIATKAVNKPEEEPSLEWESPYHLSTSDLLFNWEPQEAEDVLEDVDQKPVALSTKGHTPKSSYTWEKPYLPPPRNFSAHQLLFKVTEAEMQAQNSDAVALEKDWHSDQKEMEKISAERMEKVKEMRKSEEQVKSWSVANQVFSFMTSFTAILAGMALIATGVGAVGGALMIIGGVLQITNQLMNMLGGWKKLADALLPEGATLEQKRAIMNWIQLGIAFFCIVIAGAGGILAGFSAASQAMGAGNMFLGSIIASAFGVTLIGIGIKEQEHKHWMSAVKKRELEREKRKHSQESCWERFQRTLATMGEEGERAGWALQLIHDTNQHIQSVN